MKVLLCLILIVLLLKLPFDWKIVYSIVLVPFFFFFFNIVSGDFWRNWWEQIHFQPMLGIITVQAFILLPFDWKLLWLTLDH